MVAVQGSVLANLFSKGYQAPWLCYITPWIVVNLSTIYQVLSGLALDTKVDVYV